MSIFTRAFWEAALERAIKTFAEVAGVTVVAGQFDVLNADWAHIGSLSAGGFLASILASSISSGIGNSGPSLANEIALSKSM